jgi:hypothetical protein
MLAGGSFVVSAILSVGGAVFLVLAWDTPMRPTEFGTKGYARVVTSSATVGPPMANDRALRSCGGKP